MKTIIENKNNALAHPTFLAVDLLVMVIESWILV